MASRLEGLAIISTEDENGKTDNIDLSSDFANIKARKVSFRAVDTSNNINSNNTRGV